MILVALTSRVPVSPCALVLTTVISMHREIEKKLYPQCTYFALFSIFNDLICNILIFGIIFDYDFRQFSINTCANMD